MLSRVKQAMIVTMWVLGGLLLGYGVQTALAGGWATLTVESLPASIEAERPFTVEFSVRQHGKTLLSDLQPMVTAFYPDGSHSLMVEAEPMADAGFYRAELTLPQTGEWTWEIRAFTMTYTMPPLTVNEAAPMVAEAEDAGTAVSWPLLLGLAALVGAGLVGYAWSRQRSGWRLAGAVALTVMGLLGIGLSWQMPVVAQAEERETVTAVPAIAPEQRGEALFVAKGCIQCHVNGHVTMAETLVGIGPNLTYYKGNPDFLRTWLADPAAVKPGTQMPTLGLSDTEIETLVQFLTEPSGS